MVDRFKRVVDWVKFAIISSKSFLFIPSLERRRFLNRWRFYILYILK